MLRWDWRPACERRGGVWECVCTTVLWGRGLYDDFESFFFGGGGVLLPLVFFFGCSGPRDRFPPHCLRHCTTCSSLSASHSLRCSEALGVVLAALEAQPSQWCGGPQDRFPPHCLRHCTTCSSLSASHSLRCSEALGVVLIERWVRRSARSLSAALPSPLHDVQQPVRFALAAVQRGPQCRFFSVAFSTMLCHHFVITRTHTPRHHSGSGSHVCPNDRPLSGLP